MSPGPTESRLGRSERDLDGGRIARAMPTCVCPSAHFGAIVTLLSNVSGWTFRGHDGVMRFADDPASHNDAELVRAGLRSLARCCTRLIVRRWLCFGGIDGACVVDLGW